MLYKEYGTFASFAVDEMMEEILYQTIGSLSHYLFASFLTFQVV